MEHQPYDSPSEYEYDEYPEYPGLGLPPSQLALIIGVNAVLSLLISVGVVLIVNWQIMPSTTAGPVATVSIPIGGQNPRTVEANALPAPTTPEIVIYTVQPGDALSSIANKFDVPLYDLMVVNELTNEDFIQADQKLIIPIGGLPTPTPTFTPVPPTPTEVIAFDPPTPLPATVELPQEAVTSLDPTSISADPAVVEAEPSATPGTPSSEGVIINISQISGLDDLQAEQFSITNLGSGTSLKDWTLEGSPIGVFSFPDIFIFSGGTIRIHTKAGQSTPSDLYLNQNSVAWPIDTTLILKDDTGFEVSRLVVADSE